jgi:hypothetical protein
MIRRVGVRLLVLFAVLGTGAAVFALVEIRRELARPPQE